MAGIRARVYELSVIGRRAVEVGVKAAYAVIVAEILTAASYVSASVIARVKVQCGVYWYGARVAV
jgi:hypothetical protein